jgi:hypothetical protein
LSSHSITCVLYSNADFVVFITAEVDGLDKQCGLTVTCERQKHETDQEGFQPFCVGHIHQINIPFLEPPRRRRLVWVAGFTAE